MDPTRLSTTERGDAVLRWWEDHRRDLPWRQTRDPWAVLVCEVMAQQTQVARVAERWAPFLDRYPSAAACAAAPAGEVLRLWSGLGYNRRALGLHRCAQAIVDRHGGRLPDDLEALLALPGVGPYTARAVLAFAFERDAAVVDTNTARVLARWEGRRLTAGEVQAAADRALPKGRAWAWNQALLDLGSTVCVRRVPRCSSCPVRRSCAWAGSEQQEDPADGTAGVSVGQPRFAGSDRQARGRILEALRANPVRERDAAELMGWLPDDPARVRRVVDSLVRDGLAVRRSGRLELPG